MTEKPKKKRGRPPGVKSGQGKKKKAPDKQAESRPKAERDYKGRFIKGKSGNPKGRTPNEKSMAGALRSIGTEEIQIEIDGKMVTMSKLEAIGRKVFQSAFAGHSWAVNFIAERLDGKVPTPIGIEMDDPIKLLLEEMDAE